MDTQSFCAVAGGRWDAAGSFLLLFRMVLESEGTNTHTYAHAHARGRGRAHTRFKFKVG